MTDTEEIWQFSVKKYWKYVPFAEIRGYGKEIHGCEMIVHIALLIL
ncbi:MAG: hypothetical protein ACLTEF_10430 [[Clostridium] leptum]|uniref:Uncharacterized protein n=1 Tax=[Clostridium] leptum DSM 753 TaxID=428125 RepID=A7VPS9_9FIRM|nr:hypothetical protein CLOLEP_00556 [[Clostridium] leptum DSM 753]